MESTLQNKFIEAVESLKLRFPVADIVKKTGYQSGTVSEYLSGKKPVSEKFFKVFCEAYNLTSDTTPKASACFFMLECCGGIRFSDWNNFKVETLITGRNFKVRTTKTKSVVYLDLDVFRSLDKVIQYIQANGIVFDLQMKTTNDKLKVIGGMIGLKFGLTTHVGRHSFGTLLGEIGYTTRFIGQAMGISERTAQRYVAITRQSMDNEMQNKGGF